MENELREESLIEDNCNMIRWPKVVGLEQVFNDMEIIEEPAFLTYQERRAKSDETADIEYKGKRNPRLYFHSIITDMNRR